MVRRLLAFVLVPLVAFSALLGLLAILWGSPAAAAISSSVSGGCVPSVTSYTEFHVNDKGVDPEFTVNGSCFGNGPAFTASDSAYFRVVEFNPGTTVAFAHSVISTEGAASRSFDRWNACSSLTDGINGGIGNFVTCTISHWSNSSITFASFHGIYGDASDFDQTYRVSYGDLLAIQIWNSNTLTGPTDLYIRAGYPGTVLGSPVRGDQPSAFGSAGGSNPEVSSIGSTLPKPGHAFSNISSDLIDAAIALLLALFLTFPSNVFNSTFEENYEDILAWWHKWTDILVPAPLRQAFKDSAGKRRTEVLTRLNLAGRSPKKKLEREQAQFLAVLLAGTLLGSLLDPRWGFNVRTVLSFLAILVAMVAGVAIGGVIQSGYHRAAKHGKVPYKFEALPAGLVIAAVCVFISRASGFTPGYLYGVICGVSFGRKLAVHEEGHLIAISSFVKVALAIVAWMAWDAVTDHAEHPGSFFGTVLLDDFLASLFVSSLVGTVISLFPLRFLPGHKLQQWHKGAWLATFTITLFVLVQVLLRPHSTSSGPSHTPLVLTIVLFVLFAAASLLFREHFVRKHKRLAASTAITTAAVGGQDRDGVGPDGARAQVTINLEEPSASDPAGASAND